MSDRPRTNISIMKGVRRMAIGAILLSLFAPWFHFSDGGSFTGWHTLWMSLLPADWTAVHVALLLTTVSLATATLAGLGVQAAARLARGQPAFLAVALAGAAGYGVAWSRGAGPGGVPGVRWGVWLTVGCLAVALAVEGVARLVERRAEQR